MKTEIQSKRPRYVFDIPRDLLNEFTAAAALNNTQRNYVLLNFIKKYVAGDKKIIDALKDRYKNEKEDPIV